MTGRIDQIIADVIKAEGGYVHDPDDAGGATKYGITAAVARENGYVGDMRDLSVDVAMTIYQRRYVERPGFDRIVLIDAEIGAELVDTGVNMGPHRAAEFLQRLLNGLNHGRRYGELFVDGQAGPMTLASLRAFLSWRGDAGRHVLLSALNGLQAARYLEIAEANPSQRKFLYGWIANRVRMES